MNLSQTILNVEFSNPTVLASGIWGITASSWRRVAENGAGGVTTKSLWLKAHKGHPNPTVISNEHWTLNAVGLPDAGIEKAREEISDFMKDHPIPLIANIVAGSVEDFVKTAEEVVKLNPDFLEVNISCPNVEDEFGKPFACSELDAARVTKEVKAVSGSIPIFIKLSPQALNIGAVASACAEAGADGFTAINTVGPGMAIDLRSRKPILANKVGGLSGPGLKPISVRCIADVYRATDGKLPIIGTGGVHSGEDALELMLAGASLIGIGTAVSDRGESIFKKVCDEMDAWCEAEGVKEIGEMIGAVEY
ncbi:dihydroorotate dehydrogenase [Patescibacteria group bacterium]|nr:dihydroorotate dehydrogenase [Patescibacteria group bacterium]MBU1124279.1 dihydroorotate dehydrogenase [Patescibacteria group bacterium]MBU1911029.1 dihydroorotate dehydrogenase [Patescibacteria group bacterium]